MKRFGLIALPAILLLVGCPKPEPTPPQPAPAPAEDPQGAGENPLAQASWAGTYRGDGLELVLEAKEADYSGTVSLKGRQYPLLASGTTQLEGRFRSGEKDFAFKVERTDAGAVFETGGTRYSLTRDGATSEDPPPTPADPEPAPAPATDSEPAPAADPALAPAPKPEGFPIPAAALTTGWASKSLNGGKLTFLVPPRWKLQQAPDGISLVPPDVRLDPKGAATELYLFDVVSTPRAQNQDDPRLVALADERIKKLVPFLKRVGVGKTAGHMTTVSYRGTSPRGNDSAARVYLVLDKGATSLVLGVAVTSLLAKRDPIVQAFASEAVYDPDPMPDEPEEEATSTGSGNSRPAARLAGNLDRRFVGLWRYSTAGGGFARDSFLRLDAEGHAWYSQKMVGGTSGGSVRSGGGSADRGRWSVRGNRLKVAWDDGTILDSEFAFQGGKMYLNPNSSRPRRYQRVGD